MGEKYLIKVISNKSRWTRTVSWFWVAIDVSRESNRVAFASARNYATQRRCVIEAHTIAELIGANVMLP